jgi:type VI secretion system protein ImpH
MNRGDAPWRDMQLSALFDGLQARPRDHDFFAVLRRVEALHPHWPRLGEALRPSQEALRLGQDPELDFAPAALESFEAKASTPPRLGVRFFGLLGPQGPMPLHFTEYVRERLRSRGDATLARFLDVFHHRLLALFYRAWAQAQPAVHRDRPDADRFSAWLGAALGLDDTSNARREVPREAWLFQAGLMGARSRHPEGLAKMLSQYFQVPVRIEQHVPQWLALDTADRSRLGYSRSRAERRSTPAALLGSTACSGSRQRDLQFKFRIVLGPLTLAHYEGFLPGRPAWRALREWVLNYVGLDLTWDVQLVLAQADLPEPRLTRHARLGLTTWMGRRGRDRDRADLRLRPGNTFLLRHGAAHA